MGGLSKKSAQDILARELMRDLTATGFLRRSNEPIRNIKTYGEFGRIKDLLREPTAKSRYRKLAPRVYVQKQTGKLGGRLTFKGEREALRKSRFKKVMNYIK